MNNEKIIDTDAKMWLDFLKIMLAVALLALLTGCTPYTQDWQHSLNCAIGSEWRDMCGPPPADLYSPERNYTDKVLVLQENWDE